MMRSLLFVRCVVPGVLACALLLTGCDSIEVGGQPEEALVTRVPLRYALEATYASCTVTRNNAMHQPEQSVVTSFPWEESLTVAVSANASFVASIVATCTDAGKAGKSDVFIFADGKAVAIGSAAGFGASSQATFEVTPAKP